MLAPMFSIGEFSKLCGLSVKTLRFYHDEGVLLPAAVDDQSGYRYYSDGQLETARVIGYLRSLDFGLDEIKQIIHGGADETDVLAIVERQQAALEERIRRDRRAVRSLKQFLEEERRSIAMVRASYEVEEKVVPPLLIAGIRMRGKYADCGRGFSQIARSLGRYIAGKPLMLHYDAEYHDADADFEACLPLRRAKDVPGISVRELPGGRCASLVHRGPYDQLGRSYAKLLAYIHDRGYATVMPTREVYLKGPGMIFKGNPRNYLTEIQILLAET